MTSEVCLVVGGSGFIGSHLVQRLAKHGRRVRVYGRDPEKFRRNAGDLAGVELYTGELSTWENLEAALSDVTEIVYLAFSTVPASSMQDLHFDLESNVVPLIKFLEVVRAQPGVRRLVYVSSGGTVYGNPTCKERIKEDHPTLPISSYGLTKLTSEHYVRLCLSGSGIRSYIIRPSNAYGERQNLVRNQGVVGHFLISLVKGAPIVVYGDGGVVRDFVYVEDVARAVQLCLDDTPEPSEPPEPPGEGPVVLNVGSGVDTSIAQLIGIIEEVTGEKFNIARQPARSFDCEYNVLDISAIQRRLGWQPQVTLREGVLRTWNWILEQYS